MERQIINISYVRALKPNILNLRSKTIEKRRGRWDIFSIQEEAEAALNFPGE